MVIENITLKGSVMKYEINNRKYRIDLREKLIAKGIELPDTKADIFLVRLFFLQKEGNKYISENIPPLDELKEDDSRLVIAKFLKESGFFDVRECYTFKVDETPSTKKTTISISEENKKTLEDLFLGNLDKLCAFSRHENINLFLRRAYTDKIGFILSPDSTVSDEQYVKHIRGSLSI